MRPRSAASLAPALFRFHALLPTQTANRTTITAAPAMLVIVPVPQDQIKAGGTPAAGEGCDRAGQADRRDEREA